MKKIMKIFKIFLILLLLISLSIVVCGDTDVKYLKNISQKGIIEWQEEPKTLLEWFERLTLDEKVEIYDWWKNKNVGYFLNGKLEIQNDCIDEK